MRYRYVDGWFFISLSSWGGGRDEMLIVGCSGGFMSGLCGAWWEGEGVGGGE